MAVTALRSSLRPEPPEAASPQHLPSETAESRAVRHPAPGLRAEPPEAASLLHPPSHAAERPAIRRPAQGLRADPLEAASPQHPPSHAAERPAIRRPVQGLRADPLEAASPLHPLSHELGRRHPAARGALLDILRHRHPDMHTHLPPRALGETPLVLSAELGQLMTARAALVLDWLHGALVADRWSAIDGRCRDGWPDAGDPDVICIDLAITEADNARGWDAVLVEFQTFQSLTSTLAALDGACRQLWPELSPWRPWRAPSGGRSWQDAARQWLAPEAHACGHDGLAILLEHQPWQQFTAFDFAAARERFGLRITDLGELRRDGDRLMVDGRPVRHICNRVIPHELPDRAAGEALLKGADVSWHGHPAWYYRVNKAALTELALPEPLRCWRADQADRLPLPLDAYVAKASQSYGGRDVHLHVDADTLARLPQPASWVLQPRYRPLALTRAADGAPLYGEVRLMYALPRRRTRPDASLSATNPSSTNLSATNTSGSLWSEPPWLMASIARMSRSDMASATRQQERPGVGAVPVYWG